MDDHAQATTGSLTLAALGVVYGDIGTSPLYAMKEVFGSAHHPVPIDLPNVLGVLSLVLWALVIVVSVKYVAIVLRADNQGEGGIMALMARVVTAQEARGGKQTAVLLLGLVGTALFYGDGAITPAISVLSAVEGLQIAAPGLAPYVIPLTVIVLVTLFAVQKRGTARVGATFGPVMIVWFTVLAVLGASEIARNPVVLQAVWPGHGIAFLARNPLLGFFALGAVFLVVTGGEALYADMGHFGKRPIRLAWFGVVLPGLLLNYFGQGALLLDDPATIRNPFYLLSADWALYPLVALSTIATIIASQAVITGVYSITSQAIQLGYAPRMTIRHTSGVAIGQIYVPGINAALLVSVISLVLFFGSSSNLAGAYGIAVSGTMIVTTLFAWQVARCDWRWPPVLALPTFGCLLAIDAAFFAANSVKIVDGGWFPLVFGLGVLLLLTTWKRGRDELGVSLRDSTLPLEPFIAAIESEKLATVPLTAVFLTSNPDQVPRALLHNLKHNGVLQEQILVCHVRVSRVPRVPAGQRVSVERLSGRFARVTIHFGFMDDPDVPSTLEWCAEQGLHLDPMRTSYFLGRETLVPSLGAGMAAWRQRLFAAMFRNAGTAAVHFRLPPNRVVELGAQVAL